MQAKDMVTKAKVVITHGRHEGEKGTLNYVVDEGTPSCRASVQTKTGNFVLPRGYLQKAKR